jgi:hypothetical protein
MSVLIVYGDVAGVWFYGKFYAYATDADGLSQYLHYDGRWHSFCGDDGFFETMQQITDLLRRMNIGYACTTQSEVDQRHRFLSSPKVWSSKVCWQKEGF